MASRSELRDVLKLVWDQKVKPVVDKTYSLSEAQKAHERLEHGEQFVKIVLRP
jgi:zinc-binding alcohol dehydrogenase/oxidoreductase